MTRFQPPTLVRASSRRPAEERSARVRIGAGAHSDYGCLALLAQDDRGGLQVRNAAAAGSTPTRCLERSSSTSATCSPARPTTGLDRQSVRSSTTQVRRPGRGHRNLPGRRRAAQVPAHDLHRPPPGALRRHLPYLDETMVDQRSTDRGLPLASPPAVRYRLPAHAAEGVGLGVGRRHEWPARPPRIRTAPAPATSSTRMPWPTPARASNRRAT
jgi:hypothetical protein